MTMQRAVQYDSTGSPDVLTVRDVAIPAPADGRALIRVTAVGVTPYDLAVVSGAAPRNTPFPRGIGSDVAGVVLDVGPGALYSDGTALAPGDRVVGWGLNVAREQLIVRGTSVTRLPNNVTAEVAAALVTPALAARACLTAVPVTSSDTVVVSGATGAVGMILTQWLVATGARVIGTARESSADSVRTLGAEAVSYGDRLVEELRAIAGTFTALFDVGSVSALSARPPLGIPSDRTVTLAGEEAAAAAGVIAAPTGDRDARALALLVSQLSEGDLTTPPIRAMPGSDPAAAFRAARDGRERIVMSFP